MVSTSVVGTARFRPSPIFGLLVAVTAVLGILLWQGNDLGGAGVFAFVLAGWTVSLVLHEFSHAVVAYVSGDRSVAAKGYLTLDVRRYADPGMSLVFPLLILVIGGIGLPGGAVWIDQKAIRTPDLRSAVSAAGPLANLVCAALCLVPLRAGWIDGASGDFAIALAFLGAVQVIAFVLNMVPVPSLDGYGILEPHLPAEVNARLAPVRPYALLILIFGLWFVPPIRDAFWAATDAISVFFGGEQVEVLRSLGWQQFQFWD